MGYSFSTIASAKDIWDAWRLGLAVLLRRRSEGGDVAGFSKADCRHCARWLSFHDMVGFIELHASVLLVCIAGALLFVCLLLCCLCLFS